jgi:hypothetical protein
MARTISRETKMESQTKAKRCQLAATKTKKERASLSHGKKLSHPWPL